MYWSLIVWLYSKIVAASTGPQRVPCVQDLERKLRNRVLGRNFRRQKVSHVPSGQIMIMAKAKWQQQQQQQQQRQPHQTCLWVRQFTSTNGWNLTVCFFCPDVEILRGSFTCPQVVPCLGTISVQVSQQLGSLCVVSMFMLCSSALFQRKVALV